MGMGKSATNSREFEKEEEQLMYVCPEAASGEETGRTGRHDYWIHRNGDGVMMLIAMAMVTLRWPGVSEAEVRVVEWTREDTKREVLCGPGVSGDFEVNVVPRQVGPEPTVVYRHNGIG